MGACSRSRRSAIACSTPSARARREAKAGPSNAAERRASASRGLLPGSCRRSELGTTRMPTTSADGQGRGSAGGDARAGGEPRRVAARICRRRRPVWPAGSAAAAGSRPEQALRALDEHPRWGSSPSGAREGSWGRRLSHRQAKGRCDCRAQRAGNRSLRDRRPAGLSPRDDLAAPRSAALLGALARARTPRSRARPCALLRPEPTSPQTAPCSCRPPHGDESPRSVEELFGAPQGSDELETALQLDE